MTDVSQAGLVHSVRLGPVRRLAIIVSMLLVLGAAAASLFLVRTVDNQLIDIGTTYEVRRQARELMLAVVDAETGQRGYLLTRDESYLDPYNQAVESIDSTYSGLLRLVESNQSQRLRLEALAPSLEAKRAEMAQTISMLSAGDVVNAMSLLRSDEGKAQMDTIRNTLRAFIEEEDARLVERNGKMDGYRQMLVLAILAALGAAAILAYALFTRAQQQVAELAQRENLLLMQNYELEAHIRARTVEVVVARGRAERERARLEALLQDTNHRIGNSLATVSSLLGLQLARSRSDEVRSALEAAQGRVHAIASAHRRLRLGDDLETTDAAEFLAAVVDDLATAVPADKPIRFHQDFVGMVIPARDATTLGIVVSELVTNAVKHAFEVGRGGNIWIRLLRSEQGEPELRVEDDGRGLSDEAASGTGLGAVIIKQLARQFGGVPEYGPRAGGGTLVRVHLPQLGADGGA
jgi:two-component sensor histidine kinase/CHASE3 domain sensor protein